MGYIDHCQLLSTSFDFSCQELRIKMDAFGEEFSGVPEVDPAAEFLAREHDQLAGLEAEILPEVESHTAQQDDFLTDAFDANPNPINTQEESVGADAFGSSLDNAGFGESQEFNQAVPEPEPVQPAAPNYSLPREEEEKKKKEMKEQASKELEEWYSQHKETIEKTRLSNRNAEKELASQSAEVEPGQEWERIAKLCDFNPKASRNNKDVTRMRSIILQLKQTPPVCANGQ